MGWIQKATQGSELRKVFLMMLKKFANYLRTYFVVIAMGSR
jgi:H+/gluconate symporter-like permease